MLPRLVYATWERLTRWCRSASGCTSRIGEPHPFAELLIDCEEDRTLRAVLIGMLREAREAVAGQVDLRRRVWLVN